MAKLISDVSSQVQIVHLGKCSSRCWCSKHAYFFTIAGPRASQEWLFTWAACVPQRRNTVLPQYIG